MGALATCGDASGVVLVGHAPELGELASILLVGTPGLVKMRFETGGLVGIRVARLPPRSTGVPQFLRTPSQLRRSKRSG